MPQTKSSDEDSLNFLFGHEAWSLFSQIDTETQILPHPDSEDCKACQSCTLDIKCCQAHRVIVCGVNNTPYSLDIQANTDKKYQAISWVNKCLFKVPANYKGTVRQVNVNQIVCSAIVSTNYFKSEYNANSELKMAVKLTKSKGLLTTFMNSYSTNDKCSNYKINMNRPIIDTTFLSGEPTFYTKYLKSCSITYERPHATREGEMVKKTENLLDFIHAPLKKGKANHRHLKNQACQISFTPHVISKGQTASIQVNGEHCEFPKLKVHFKINWISCKNESDEITVDENGEVITAPSQSIFSNADSDDDDNDESGQESEEEELPVPKKETKSSKVSSEQSFSKKKFSKLLKSQAVDSDNSQSEEEEFEEEDLDSDQEEVSEEEVYVPEEPKKSSKKAKTAVTPVKKVRNVPKTSDDYFEEPEPQPKSMPQVSRGPPKRKTTKK